MSQFDGYARGPKGEAPLTDYDWLVRTQVYASFGRSGTPPTIDDLAALTGGSPSRVEGSLLKLQDAHELTLDGAAGVAMAHPFSASPTDYPVETPDFDCYANCAWDALGLPAILGTNGWTRTTCPSSGEELEFGVERRRVKGDGEIVIHLLTPLRDAWDDIGFT